MLSFQSLAISLAALLPQNSEPPPPAQIITHGNEATEVEHILNIKCGTRSHYLVSITTDKNGSPHLKRAEDNSVAFSEPDLSDANAAISELNGFGSANAACISNGVAIEIAANGPSNGNSPSRVIFAIFNKSITGIRRLSVH
jgi:hypothetical protein